jgi:hypothetical protein
MAEGSWIFLSHSHRDFDKVREVRNVLEEKDHNPLMFFLKCLSDDNEIDDLIRREIEARSWFILCDSENARNSSWVQQEIEIIKGYPEKTYAEVNLDDPNVDIEQALSQLTRKASVFLTYTRHDRDLAAQIKAELRANDFGVFSTLEMLRDGDFGRRADREFYNVSKLGAILLIASKNSVQSVRQSKAIESAAKIFQRHGSNANVILLYRDQPEVVNVAAPEVLRQVFSGLNAFDLSGADFHENMNDLMQQLRGFEWRD